MNDANQGHRRRLPGGRRPEETAADQATTRDGIRLPHQGSADEQPSDVEVTHTGIRLPRGREAQPAPDSDEEVTHTGIHLPRQDRPRQDPPSPDPQSPAPTAPDRRPEPPPAGAAPAGYGQDPAATTDLPQEHGPGATSVLPVAGRPGAAPTENVSAVDGGTMPVPASGGGFEQGSEQGPDGGPPPKEKRRSGLVNLLRELAIVVSVALVISFLVKTFLAQPFWIPSGSMNDTLIRGDRVIVSKLTPSPVDLNRGDVIVFEDPGGWLPPVPQDRGPVLKGLEFVGLYPAGDNHLIKRVIGMPGDKVVCCDDEKRLTVNGTPLDEPYLHEGDQPSSRKFSITVPADKVWVMGDHRSDSSDSRFHDDGTGKSGSVPIDKITGRALVTVWPFDRLGWLSDHGSTFEKVEAK